jgi:hypothetical protein
MRDQMAPVEGLYDLMDGAITKEIERKRAAQSRIYWICEDALGASANQQYMLRDALLQIKAIVQS